MNFNSHSELEGSHSVLSASQNAWVNYDEDKMAAVYRTRMAQARGTELHEFAARAIALGIKLAETQTTLNMYVNDAIGFRMKPEVVLMYSFNAYGTADAISFTTRKDGRSLLRVHDLKTGVNPTTFTQLMVYGAYFCLEYNFKPIDIDFEFRIYQNDEIKVLIPEYDDIYHIIDRLINFDRLIDILREEEF